MYQEKWWVQLLIYYVRWPEGKRACSEYWHLQLHPFSLDEAYPITLYIVVCFPESITWIHLAATSFLHISTYPPQKEPSNQCCIIRAQTIHGFGGFVVFEVILNSTGVVNPKRVALALWKLPLWSWKNSWMKVTAGTPCGRAWLFWWMRWDVNVTMSLERKNPRFVERFVSPYVKGDLSKRS